LAAPGFCSGIAHVHSTNRNSRNFHSPSNGSTNQLQDSVVSTNSNQTAVKSTNLTNESQADPRPDLQLHMLSYTPALDFGLNSAGILNLKEEAMAFFNAYGGQETASILPTLQRPRSRGYIKIRSADPFQHPEINPRCVLFMLHCRILFNFCIFVGLSLLSMTT
jgi:hypothetical protein